MKKTVHRKLSLPKHTIHVLVAEQLTARGGNEEPDGSSPLRPSRCTTCNSCECMTETL